MRRGHAVSLLASLVAASLLVGGCGQDDPFAAYCEEVKTQQRAISEAQAENPESGLVDALPSFKKLRAQAPEDIRDEWKTVITKIQALSDALEAAGVEPADYDPKKTPASLTPDQRRAISSAATDLAAPETAAALDGVEQQARDVCKTPLTV